MARYLVALRPNGHKHQVDILDLAFLDVPRLVEMDAERAASIRKALTVATTVTKDEEGRTREGKAIAYKDAFVFVPESAMKGQTVEEYLASTATPSRKQQARKAAAEKAVADAEAQGKADAAKAKAEADAKAKREKKDKE
jgi:hypothetical protein